jgi:DNA-binding transcriptional regulator YdaS (Cro superfamily)
VLISQWRTGRRPVPAERCPEIEKATLGVVRCEDLLPEVDWNYLRTSGDFSVLS